MLNKETFFNYMDKLINVYPNWRLRYDDPDVMRMWYGFFDYMDCERFSYMVDEFIANSDRFPTIAGLKRFDNIPRKTRDQIAHEKMLKENGLL